MSEKDCKTTSKSKDKSADERRVKYVQLFSDKNICKLLAEMLNAFHQHALGIEQQT